VTTVATVRSPELTKFQIAVSVVSDARDRWTSPDLRASDWLVEVFEAHPREPLVLVHYHVFSNDRQAKHRAVELEEGIRSGKLRFGRDAPLT
jgi:hypothetical protein